MRSLLLILLTLWCHCATLAQHRDVVLFYNVENLFDTINDPTTADEDFLPLADREWNSNKYQTKISRIAQIIAEVSPSSLPTFIGLAEVENRGVVEDIAKQRLLANANYTICHSDSPDERGIDVALLYRADRFHLQGSRAIRANTDSPTRDMLTLWGTMDGRETFIAVVHWPSRIGGVKFTEGERRRCAQQLRSVVDSVLNSNPQTQIIIMGDMNDNPSNKSLKEDLRSHHRTDNRYDLHNPFYKSRTHRGSSLYDGRWNMYDNIIVSSNIPLLPIRANRKGGILKHKLLLDRRYRPLPTYRNAEYTEGVSDHLPVYIVIEE